MNSTFGKPWYRWEKNVKRDRNEKWWKDIADSYGSGYGQEGPETKYEKLMTPQERLQHMTQLTTKFINKYT
jgi:hypothetical protein